MSLFELKFSQMILHTETSKLMYNGSFLFEVLHKPTLLPSTFKVMMQPQLPMLIAKFVSHDIEHYKSTHDQTQPKYNI